MYGYSKVYGAMYECAICGKKAFVPVPYYDTKELGVTNFVGALLDVEPPEGWLYDPISCEWGKVLCPKCKEIVKDLKSRKETTL